MTRFVAKTFCNLLCQHVCQSDCFSVHPSDCPPVCPSFCPSFCSFKSVDLFVGCLSIYLSVRMSLSVRLLFVCLSIRRTLCSSISLSVQMFVLLLIHLSDLFFCPSICFLSVHLSIQLLHSRILYLLNVN